MEREPGTDDSEHDDERAADPPSEGAETEPPGSPDSDQAGPMGNPAVDEEALRNHQQDG